MLLPQKTSNLLRHSFESEVYSVMPFMLFDMTSNNFFLFHVPYFLPPKTSSSSPPLLNF